MAIPIASILKNLAPIVGEAASFLGRKSAENLKNEERLRKLEDELIRSLAVTMKLAEQTQAIAEELRAQDAVNAAQEKKMKLCLVVAIVASGVAVAAIVIALVH
ncbi:MAG: hypothetical protein ABIZ81_12265 [Opitutaceae bacterium]